VFGFRRYPDPYTTPGNPSKGHVGRTQTLDDGTVYAHCTCGWSATGRGEVSIDPRTMLSNHISNASK
jgi:hypothetical protein